MCGRMVRVWDEALRRWVFRVDPAFEGRAVADLITRNQYNIAPSLRIPILASALLDPGGETLGGAPAHSEDLQQQPSDSGPRDPLRDPHTRQPAEAFTAAFRLQPARWGFPRPGNKGGVVMNTRIESALESPMWRTPFANSACIVPATGFYEWRTKDGTREPHYIRRADGKPMLLGGVAAWRGAGEAARLRASVVTCTPNKQMASLHDRMPVIVEEEDVGRWLTGNTDARLDLAVPSATQLKMHRVGDAVNNAKTDGGPALLEPLLGQARLE